MHSPSTLLPINALAMHLRGLRLCILSGAGISTDSGIPDYRGPGTIARARKPIQFRQFLKQEHGRQRYWARSALGWPTIRESQPNEGHRAVAALEDAGITTGVITQNVDRLHHKAGSRRIVELHGALAEVRCLACQDISSRQALQEKLESANSWWFARRGDLAPDGDVDIEDSKIADFVVPPCNLCGGLLKPNVVFFGESVPRDTVEAAWEVYRDADALLVLGSSLAVFSGYRFVKRAAEEEKPVFIINQSETRGDALADAICRDALGSALPALAHLLG